MLLRVHYNSKVCLYEFLNSAENKVRYLVLVINHHDSSTKEQEQEFSKPHNNTQMYSVPIPGKKKERKKPFLFPILNVQFSKQHTAEFQIGICS